MVLMRVPLLCEVLEVVRILDDMPPSAAAQKAHQLLNQRPSQKMQKLSLSRKRRRMMP